MLSRLVAIIQVTFASKAELNSLAFLKPRPPMHFGQQIFSNAFQAIYLPRDTFGFHQNLLVRESKLPHILEGILNEDIM